MGAVLIQTTKTFKREAKRVARDQEKGKGRIGGTAHVAKRLDEEALRAPRPAVHPRAEAAGRAAHPQTEVRMRMEGASKAGEASKVAGASQTAVSPRADARSDSTGGEC